MKTASQEDFSGALPLVSADILSVLLICFLHRFGDDIPGMEGLGTGELQHL